MRLKRGRVGALIRTYLHTKRARPSSPLYLIHFLTNKCDAHCPHCFVPQLRRSLAGGSELSLEENLQVIRSLGPEVMNVNLTGGEVFLLPWLPDVIDAYAARPSIRSMLLTTHGGATEHTIETMARVSASSPDVRFNISVSLDGPPDLHDRLRGSPGLFDRAVSTYRGLLGLGRENLAVQACFCLQDRNRDRWREIVDFLVFDTGIRNMVCTWTRDEGDEVSPEQLAAYEECSQYFDRLARDGSLEGFPSTLDGRLLNAKNRISRRIIRRIAGTGEFVAPCVASRLFGVMMADGSVYPCEMRLDDCLGNLRDVEYDLKRLWRSDRTARLHEEIRTQRCTCTHECAWTANILFSGRFHPELIWRLLT